MPAKQKKPIRVIRTFTEEKVHDSDVSPFNRSDCKWYSKVPKDLKKNVQFRYHILKQVQNDKKAQEEVWIACKRDPLFWINTFGWTYDPRNPNGMQQIPFLTFDCQDELIFEMIQALGRYDILIEKSRDMGVSWCSLAVLAHQFIFERDQQFALASRKGDLVDKTGSKDALFWKLEYLFKEQPGWMKPNYVHNQMILTNPEMSGLILGESATGEIGRAGRNRAIFLDEFPVFSRDDGYRIEAATASNTNCRIFNGTPNGTGSAFFDVRQGLESGERAGKLLRVHWTEDLRKNFGLYTSGKGYKTFYPGASDHDRYADDDLVLLSRTPRGHESDEYDFGPDYKFVLDGKIRSPWYDKECRRYAHPMLLAQELDIDYHNSSFRFFDEEVIQKILEEQVMDPFRVGEFEFDPTTNEYLGFKESEKGSWRLWFNLDSREMMPESMSVVIGADISAGTGSSNSTLSVVNDRTGEKIASYANAYISPEDFGRHAANIFKVFNEPYMIWENNGPGRNFGRKLLEGGVWNYYHRRDDSSIKYKVSDIPGWASTEERKYTLLSEYRDAQHKGHYTNPDHQSVKECREYINLPGNRVVHVAEKDSIDPTGAGKGHGDRVMADAIAYKGVQEAGNWNSTSHNVPEERPIREGTFGSRFKQAINLANESNNDDLWFEEKKEWAS